MFYPYWLQAFHFFSRRLIFWLSRTDFCPINLSSLPFHLQIFLRMKNFQLDFVQRPKYIVLVTATWSTHKMFSHSWLVYNPNLTWRWSEIDVNYKIKSSGTVAVKAAGLYSPQLAAIFNAIECVRRFAKERSSHFLGMKSFCVHK